MLSSTITGIPSLVRVHGGTAACLGVDKVQATTLDKVFQEVGDKIDFLKIDVDGYDGEVLAGAKTILREHQPFVIFEWHPPLWSRMNKDYMHPFEVLKEADYDALLWFDNSGEFSHFSNLDSSAAIQQMARYLNIINNRRDQHFDILAIPRKRDQNVEEIAALVYAREASERLPVL